MPTTLTSAVTLDRVTYAWPDGVRAIERGDVDERHFDTVGDDWDVEARATAALAEVGLPDGALDRRVGELSGGEAVLAALVGVRLRGAEIALLDEPTNNLDRDARARVHELVRTWRGTLIVVSHDVALLEQLDDTAELYEHELSVFGGPYSAWKAWLDTEQAAAVQAETAARQLLRREKRDRQRVESAIAMRNAHGKKLAAKKAAPKIVLGAMKRSAEVTADKLRVEANEKVEAARAAVDTAGRRVRDDDTVHIDLPDPGVGTGRRIATIGDGERSWTIQGPERVALVGPNGAGKTTLLERLVASAFGDGAPYSVSVDAARVQGAGSARVVGDAGSAGLNSERGAAATAVPFSGDEGADPAEAGPDAASFRSSVRAEAHTDRVGYLSQRVDGLDEAASVLANVRAGAPGVGDAELRNRLARFLIRGDTHSLLPVLQDGTRYARAGIMLTDLRPAHVHEPLALFRHPHEDLGIAELIEKVQRREGRDLLGLGYAGLRPGPAWQMKREILTPRATTHWDELVTALA